MNTEFRVQRVAYRRVTRNGPLPEWVEATEPPSAVGEAFDEYHSFADLLHRTDGPAVVYRRLDGSVNKEGWWLDGELHREDGPAVVEYFLAGLVDAEEWWVRGREHRVGGPAVTLYENGAVHTERWLLHGARCRYDGPAVVSYDPDTRAVIRSEWWVDDRALDTESEVLLHLAGYSAGRFAAAFKTTVFYRDLLTAHPGTEEEIDASVTAAAEGGIRTFDGVLEVVGGAPVEWVRSFEQSGAA